MTLDQIALKYGTDKSSKHHNYCGYYDNHFSSLRDNRITILEIGYGGYEYPDRGGEGARTWHEYFALGNIVSIDLHQKTNLLNSSRYRFYKGSQDDEAFLNEVISEIGAPDIIIDDGSHQCPHMIKSFEVLFPLLKSGGWYVLEDIEGSFWNSWSKGTQDYNDFYFPSPVNLGRKLINEVNKKHIIGFESQYPIESIHFYTNIIFIKKA
jgi:hypothetical protein